MACGTTANCSDDPPHRDEDTALFRIEVIEILMDNPWESRIINRPFVFADPESGVRAGLWEGDGPDTQSTNETNHCHDITAAFTPQRQQRVTWPDQPIVARTYMDQLQRSNNLPPADTATLDDALGRAETLLEDGKSDTDTASDLESLAANLAREADNAEGITRKRREELAATLEGIAGQLRQGRSD